MDREHIQVSAVMFAYYASLALFFFIPALVTFGLAFFHYDLISSARFAGLANISGLFTDEILHISLRNSLQFISLAVPARILLAFSLALLLHKQIFGISFFRAGVLIPSIIPDTAYALLWFWIFNPLYGPLNQFLIVLGIPPIPWFTDAFSTQMLVIFSGLFQIGEYIIIFLAVRLTIPAVLYELMQLEGASSFAMFRFITVPLMFPMILLVFFRDVMVSLQSGFTPAHLLTHSGPPPYATLYVPVYMYTQAFEYLQFGYASAISLILFLITAGILLIQYIIITHWRAGISYG